MSRDTTTTVRFDFTFRYARAGLIEEGNCITVCEPNYEKRNVYRRMQGYLAEAQSGILKRYDFKELGDAAEKASADAPDTEKVIKSINTMRMGLSMDEYPRFCDWLQKELTDARALAFVGDDLTIPPKERIPVGEGVWMSIAENGGLGQIEEVLSAFTDFFLSGRESPKAVTPPSETSGSETPSGSPPRLREVSRSKKQ